MIIKVRIDKTWNRCLRTDVRGKITYSSYTLPRNWEIKNFSILCKKKI